MFQHLQNYSSHRATPEEKERLDKEITAIIAECIPEIKRYDLYFATMGPEQLCISHNGNRAVLTCYLLLNAMGKPYYQREAIAFEIKTELGIK